MFNSTFWGVVFDEKSMLKNIFIFCGRENRCVNDGVYGEYLTGCVELFLIGFIVSLLCIWICLSAIC